MILDQLVLHNFGVYQGRQVIDLTPKSRKKPVILFGGLNGGGKTTLLDALQLVLYGKLAECSNRGDLGYDEYLRRSIHRGADPRDGASIELEFRHTSEGQQHTFRIHRSWTVRQKSVRERVEVIRDGALDQMRTDGWAEQVEDLIPVRLAKFFFFDGEKIESLADLDRSAEALSTAIHALLGLDLVDQLVTDLVVLERRKRTEQKSAVERQAIEAAKEEAEKLSALHDELILQRASAQNAVDLAQKRVREAEERFLLGGGEAFERRKEVELKRDGVAERLNAVEEELRDLAGDVAPFLLVLNLIDTVVQDDELEHHAAQREGLIDLLAARDARVLETAEACGASRKVIEALQSFFATDLSAREAAAGRQPYLHLSSEGHSELMVLQAGLRGEIPSRIARLVKQSDKLQLERDNLDRKLASTPDQDAIAQLAAARVAAKESLAKAEQAQRVIDREVERISREHDQKWAIYKRRMDEGVEDQLEQQAISRILSHSEQVRDTLQQFRTAVAQRHVRRIEQFITEGLQHLLHKQSLVSGVRIDPASFAISLLGANGQELSPERLSAGERQLLAVSTIWALARASGRSLPVVIDTPLGRLDSIHRQYLVERYFPAASHQVLLLSTDKEIDESHYDMLRSSVGRAYHLRFDDRTSSTSIEPGYFW